MRNILIIFGMKRFPVGVGFVVATIYARAQEANTKAEFHFTFNYEHYLNTTLSKQDL
jgi:hypothetical protein